MSFRTPTTIPLTPTLSPKTLVAAHHTVSSVSKNHLTSPHTPKSQTISKITICPHAPKKSLTVQNGPVVKVEAIASDVFQSALRVPALLTPPSVTVCAQPPLSPTKPLRGLPYRAPSTWGPRRGAPVQAPKVEAEAVMARVDSFMSVPPLTSLPVACGPQPVKTITKILKAATITPQRSNIQAIKTPGAPRKNGKIVTNSQPSKSRSNGRAVRKTPIENIIASEYVVVDSSEIVTPPKVSRAHIPQAPRKKVVSTNTRFVNKVGRLVFSSAPRFE